MASSVSHVTSEPPQKSYGQPGKGGLNIRDVLTDEQIALYREAVLVRGFDFPKFHPHKNSDSVIGYCHSSIQKYNKINGTNYEFVRSADANILGVSNFILCLTFEAKDKDDADGQSNIFRANVFEDQPISVGKTHEAIEDVFK